MLSKFQMLTEKVPTKMKKQLDFSDCGQKMPINTI